MKLVEKTLQIIKHFQDKNPNLKFYIENPRGVLRKLGILDEVPFRNTVSYCQYGDMRMKPTDIWTNNSNWIPKKCCKNGDKCHVSAPRGSRTGTQGLSGAYDRSKIPEMLCIEAIEAVDNSLAITQR